MGTYKKQKVVTNYVCSCSARMLTKHNDVKVILNFQGARIAAINLFQVDFDKPWNHP